MCMIGVLKKDSLLLYLIQYRIFSTCLLAECLYFVNCFELLERLCMKGL